MMRNKKNSILYLCTLFLLLALTAQSPMEAGAERLVEPIQTEDVTLGWAVWGVERLPTWYPITFRRSSSTSVPILAPGIRLSPSATAHAWRLRGTYTMPVPDTYSPITGSFGVTNYTFTLHDRRTVGGNSSTSKWYGRATNTYVTYPCGTRIDLADSGEFSITIFNPDSQYNFFWTPGGELRASSDYQLYHSVTVNRYFPIVNSVTPSPVSSSVDSMVGMIPTNVIPPIELAKSNMGIRLLDMNTFSVHSGYTNRLLTLEHTNDTMLPTSQGYALINVSGAPMNDGTHVTGIGKTRWKQRVTDFDGDSTEFERDVTITTDKRPNILIAYATGDLENTPFTDGTANGGINGWSNIPLKATVHTKNTDNTYIVDGYYFNQLNDELGGITHGGGQKDDASTVYNSNTSGMWLTGVMVDNAKTTELSATTEPVTIKIDMDNPIAAVSYNTATDTLINDSSDALSGLQTTKVAIVSAGAAAPAESDYEDFSEWQSFISENGQYDIYVLAIDNAGNKATATLSNQLLTGLGTSLEVSKTVVGKYGDYNKRFEVTVTLKDDADNPVNATYTARSSVAATGDFQVTFANGVAIIHVTHGETVAIQGLSNGYTYTVKETDVAVTQGNSPYQVTYNGNASETGITNTLGAATAQVAIENTRETIPDMGIFEESHKFAIGSAVLLFASLIITITICERKRKLK